MADESNQHDSYSSENPSEYLLNLDETNRSSFTQTVFNKARNVGSNAARVVFCGAGVALTLSSAQAVSALTGIDPTLTTGIASMISELFTGETIRRIVGSDDISNDDEVLEIIDKFNRKLSELQEEYRFDLNDVLEQIDDFYNMGGEIVSILNIQTELIQDTNTRVKDIQRWTRKDGKTQLGPKDTSINLLTGRYNPDSFVGRQEILRDIDEGLSNNGAFLLLGEPGIGKTSIARQFIELSSDLYQHVLWIDATNEKTIQRDIRQIGIEININDPDYPDNETGVMNWLNNTNDTYVLVFDGAANYDLIENFIPKDTGNGHILVTSNDRSLRYDFPENAEIHAFTSEEAEDFLYSRLGDQGQYVSSLASTLGYHPEALDRAAKFIDLAKLSIEDYLDIFGEKSQKLFHTVPAALGLNQITTTVDRITLDELAEIMPESKEIGYLLSFMASNKIPRGILYGFDELPLEGMSETLADESVAIEALALLHRYGLIGLDEDYISMSPSTQVNIRAEMKGAIHDTCLEDVFRLLYSFFPFDRDDHTTWAPSIEVIPHILNLITISQDYPQIGDSELIRDLSQAMIEFRELSLAETLIMRMLEVDIDRYGEDSMSTALDYELLGDMYSKLAYDDPENKNLALDYFNRSYKIRLKYFKPEDAESMSSLSGIGVSLSHLGWVDEALEIFRDCLDVMEHELGFDATINSMAGSIIHTNIAICYKDLGMHEEALERFQLVLDAQKNSGNPNAYFILHKSGTLSGIAELHYKMRNYRESIHYMSESIEIAISIYGKKEIRHSMNGYQNIGECFFELGEYEKALKYFQEVQSICSQIFDQDYSPQKVTAILYAGSTYRNLGNLEMARKYYLEAKRLIEESNSQFEAQRYPAVLDLISRT